MKKIALFLVVTSSLFANIDVKSLDIFTNQSFVNQEIKSGSKSVDLLGQVRLEDIRFTISQGCSVNSTDLKYVDFENDTLTAEIRSLKGYINTNQNKIKSLKSNIAFLEKTSINSISSASNLKETSKFIKQEILENHNKIYELENDLKKQQQKLNELNKKKGK